MSLGMTTFFSFILIISMLINTTMNTTIYTTMYSTTIYKKKKEESKEERRNIRLSREWLLGLYLRYIYDYIFSFILIIIMKHKNIALIPEHIRNQHAKNNSHEEGVQNLMQWMNGTILDPQEE